MRVFIAIDINDKIRKAIADLQRQIASKVDVKKVGSTSSPQGDVKWVEPENIHLTLKFLGEIKDEQAGEVCEISKKVAEAHKNFDIDIESVGTFGGRSAKIIWVGVGKGADELITLQKDLEDQLAQAGYPPEEREFSAHLTLCRVRNPKAGVKLAEAVKQFERLKLGSVATDALCVYQSQLTPAGPIYTLLGSFELAKN